MLDVSFQALIDFVKFPLRDFLKSVFSAVEPFFGVFDSLEDLLFLVDPVPPDLLDLDDQPDPPATDGVSSPPPARNCSSVRSLANVALSI